MFFDVDMIGQIMEFSKWNGIYTFGIIVIFFLWPFSGTVAEVPLFYNSYHAVQLHAVYNP